MTPKRKGTPQGLAVYQNGMRINEAFGVTVNWASISAENWPGISIENFSSR
jgi:hypothetical protein